MKHLKIFAATAALLLASCGGGGGDAGGTPPIGGIQGSGRWVSVGAITGFGSIFVNGVEFATTGAQISIGDRSGTEAELRIGQVVAVQGTVDANGTTGAATRVSFSSNVEGPVTQLDVAAGTFVVLGQTVRVTGATHFDDDIVPSNIQGLAAPGIIVEVSGFPTANGEISATRIEREDPGSEFEVKGVVQGLDTNAHTFRVNALTVDYSGVTPEGTLADGRTVEVKGRTLSAAGALVATRVEVSPGIGAAANDEVELEGLITHFTSNADFEIAGQRVTTNAGTQFDLKGVTLALDVRVEVEGVIDANGVLVAREVEVEPENSARAAGLVESVNAAGNTLRVAGVTVTTNAATQFEDKTSQPLRPLRLADLRTGDFVEVRGTEPQGGGLTASIVERDDPEGDVTLQGVARNVADPNLVILGVTVTVDAGTEFEDAADAPITRAQFFAQAPDRLVKAKGTLSGTTLVAEEIELED
ncbi:MAG: DUF5666 domain-containing protein [Steroidobacteraceae bacterium]